MMHLTICPSCGNHNIQRVQKDWHDEFQGQAYTVPVLEFYECPDCGERMYDRQAMRKIEMYSPAFRQRQKPKQPRQKRRIAVRRKKKPLVTT